MCSSLVVQIARLKAFYLALPLFRAIHLYLIHYFDQLFIEIMDKLVLNYSIQHTAILRSNLIEP